MSSGFVDGLDNGAYHDTDDVSKSTLDMVERDLYAPMWAKKCPQDQDKIKTFDFGDAMHAICLEPERLRSEFVTMPPFNLRTTAGKEEKAAFEKESQGKKILTDLEHKKLNLMFESVMAYIPARQLIEAEGVAERSYFWQDESTGLGCKCRPDKNIKSRPLIVDVKTTPDLKKFCYAVDDYRYHVQDAWYCDGVSRFEESVTMEFLVIQKTVEIGRYPVMVVRLPDEAIEYGRDMYRNNLNQYAEFMESGQAPETVELCMSHRFNQKIEEHFGEVF